MSTRRVALPKVDTTTHPMEDILTPQHGVAEVVPQREVQLNVRIDSEISRALDRALLILSLARGEKVTKKAGIEEAIGLLLDAHKLD